MNFGLHPGTGLTATAVLLGQRLLGKLRHSLLGRVVLIGLALIATGLVGRLTVMVPYLRDATTDIVARQQVTLAEYVAKDIDNKLLMRLNALDQIAHRLPTALLQHPDSLDAWLKSTPGLNTALFGHMALAPFAAGGPGTHAAQTPERQQALEGGRAVIGTPVADPATQQPELVFLAPVRDGQERLTAILVAGVPLDQPGFLDTLQQTPGPQQSDFLLVSTQDGLYVAAADPAMRLKPIPAIGVNPSHDRVMQGFRGSFVGANEKGVKSITAIAKVSSAGWLLVARLPYEVIQLPIEAIGQRFFVAAGFLLLFFLVFAGVVLRRLFRPLTQSAKQLRQMASGHEPLRALPVVYPDEVGELAGGFNKLLSQLEANMQALRESEASMALLARHDALTGLPNRSVLEERLQQTGEQASRLESHASLLFLDLDGFKAVNDQHGHKVGDSLLREVAQRLQAHRRKLDLVVRLGGDEFVILLQNKGHNPAAVHLVAQQCIDDMGRPFQVEGLTLALGVSIGIAHQQQGQKADLLLLQADMAMYAAKNAGRNQFCEYHPDMKAPGTAPPTPDIQSH